MADVLSSIPTPHGFERVVWRLEKFEQPPINILALVNTIQVTNSGARAGCIQDMILEVSTPRGSRLQFLPAHYLDLNTFFRPSPGENKSLLHFVQSPFYPVFLQGRGQQTVAILFLPSDPETLSRLTPGDHAVKLRARVCGKGNYREFGTLTYELAENDIVALENGLSFSGVSKEVEQRRPKP